MILFRSTHEALIAAERHATLIAAARADELREDLREARREIRTLTRTIIALKEAGKELDPTAMDDRWPDGKYVQSDYEDEGGPAPQAVPAAEAADLEADLARDLAIAFPDD